MGESRFVAVDWGTSSFRLWLMAHDGAVLAESRSGEGMTQARETGFSRILDAHLAQVAAPADAPVIICGMAGAKQGWVEAGYVDVPARLSSIFGQAVRIDDDARDIRILPGLALRDSALADVMRGEETQLLGAAQAHQATDCLVAMPGTHSKWVRLVGDDVVGFSTFMTGELFEAISGHTILSHALAGSDHDVAASSLFVQSVGQALREPELVTSKLFAIRARGLLFGLSARDAEASLSGLLIGIELAGALKSALKNTPIILVAAGKLKALYEAAFHSAGLTFSTIDADRAVRAGLTNAARAIWQNA